MLLRNTILKSPNGVQYVILNQIHESKSSIIYEAVVKVEIPGESMKKQYAIKVSKPGKVFGDIIKAEANKMKYIKEQLGEIPKNNLVAYQQHFILEDSVYIVMELLSNCLYDFMKKHLSNKVGFPLKLVRFAARNILDSLICFQSLNLVHGDISPTNILFDLVSQELKLIDFKSCHSFIEVQYETFQYIYYRAPEVVLRIHHDSRVDIWSLGCLLLEMFLFFPFFIANDESQLLHQIVRMIGEFPKSMIDRTNYRKSFFDDNGHLLSIEALYHESYPTVSVASSIFTTASIRETIMKYSPRLNNENEIDTRESFADFIEHCLILDPEQRFHATDAIKHPFIVSEI